MLFENQYKSSTSENYKKYFSFNGVIFLIGLIFSIVYLYLFLTGSLLTYSWIDFFLVLLTWLNIFIFSPIMSDFDRFSQKYSTYYIFSKLVKNFKEAPLLYKYSFNIELVLATHLMVTVLAYEMIGFAYFFNLNLLIVVFYMGTLLLMSGEMAQYRYLPRDTCAIQFLSGDIVNDVFIVREIANEYIIIISPDDKITQIPVSSINRIFRNEPLSK
jgi:hypothetical protein